MYLQSVNRVVAVCLAAVSMAAVAAAEDSVHPKAQPKSEDNPSTASVTSPSMGPAAFMWPPDRVWSGDMDNQAPCGSRASAGNRTKFPLAGGAVALVAQDDYYNSKISISYSNNPTTNADFTTILEAKDLSDLNPGHTCAKTPDTPPNVSAGDNATLQFIYKADWDAPHNQTFYACADITFVKPADFDIRIPCFNATEPGEDDRKAAQGPKSGTSDSGKPGPAGDSGAAKAAPGTAGGAKLGGGAVAGITIGSLAGFACVAAGFFFLYRRKQQHKRKLRLARMEENARRDQYPLDKYSHSSNS